MKHTIVITESQYRRLTESVNSSVITSALNSCTKYREMVQYCNTNIGTNIGLGSSRVVYQLDDEKVIKVAYNEKGTAQNKEEAESTKRVQKYSFIPRVYDYNPDGRWIISEYVLPAEKEDFEQCLGIDLQEFKNILYTIELSLNGKYVETHPDYIKGQQIPIFREIEDYCTNSNAPVGDLIGIRNWGLGLRDGKEHLILLDHGLNEEILNKYYRGVQGYRSTIM